MLSDVDPSERLRPLQVTAGEVTYPPGGRLGPRWQADVQLVLVHRGSARISVDGTPRAVLGEHTAGLLLPGHRERFVFARDGPTRHSWVQARLADPPPALIARLSAAPAAMPASTSLGELVREAVATARTPSPAAEPLLRALAAAALWRYVGEAESRGAGRSDVVALARAYLHAHLGDPHVALRDVAEAAHVSPPHLVRRFRAELGTTPMAYLWARRVATGIDFLTYTGLPVGEIARRCGFASVYHFSRRVKQHAGASPTAVRRRRWESRW